MELQKLREESSFPSKHPGGPCSVNRRPVGGDTAANWLSTLSLLELRAQERWTSWPIVLLDILRPREGRPLLLVTEH